MTWKQKRKPINEFVESLARQISSTKFQLILNLIYDKFLKSYKITQKSLDPNKNWKPNKNKILNIHGRARYACNKI